VAETPPDPEAPAEEPRTMEDILAGLTGDAGGGGTQPSATAGNPTRLSPGAEDAVRRAIRGCWNVDANAADVPAVEVVVRMRADGTVASANVADGARYGRDQAFRVAADRALRAVRNPACQPWPLPSSEWPRWEVIELNFDPSDYF
jgi:hypothetical protein